MPRSVERELTRVRRLSTLAIGLRGFGDAALVTGLGLGSLAIAMRVAGSFVEPSWWWSLALIPPIAWSAYVVARERPGRALCTAHLDRRYGLGGLLVAGLERSTSAWQSELASRLSAVAADARVRLRPWRDFGRAVVGGAFLGGIALLPPPDPHGPDAPPRALVAAVEDLGQRVEEAATAEAVEPARADELRARIRELEERLVDGDAVAWSDVDAMREWLAHEQGVQAGGLAAVRAGAQALARDAAEAGVLDDLDPDAVGELARFAERATALGLDAELPDELREALEALARAAAEGGQPGDLDMRALGLDAEQLRRLGEALEGAAGQRLRHLAERLPADQLGDLRALLEGEGLGGFGAGQLPVAQGGQGGFDPESGPDGDGAPGRGGVNRGRGDAALEGTHTMDVDTEALRSERLPPGSAVPEQWQRLGVSRAEPEAAPNRPTAGAGVRGPTDDPGAAAWRRRLAPRHQDAVRRFFSTPSEERR